MRQTIGLLLFFVPFFCPAQKGTAKGFFMLSTGDTIQGLVQLKSLEDFASTLILVEEPTKAKRAFLPEEVAGAVLEGNGAVYHSFAVSLELSAIDKQNLMVKNEGITASKVLLLQKIYAGAKMDLYRYHTGAKDYYFVYSNGKLEELLMLYKTNDTRKLPSYQNLYRVPSYTIHPFYRDQLLRYFDWRSNKSLALKVAELDYEKEKILALVKEIDSSE